MSSIEVNPFDATTSVLAGISDDEFRTAIERNLGFPLTRSDFIDFVSAQQTINVTIAASLVSMMQGEQTKTDEAITRLLEQVQITSDNFSRVLAKLMMRDKSGNISGDSDV